MTKSNLLLLQRQSAHHRGAAEFLPHAVDCALGERLAPAGLIEQVARVGLVGLDDVGGADADQAEARAVGLAREQLAPGGKYFLRELGRVAKPARTRADLEVVALELERDRAAGKTARLEARRDFFRERPQAQFERAERGEIAVEGRLRRYAFCFPLRRHLALVDAAREARQPQPFDAVTAREVALGCGGEVADREEAVALEPRSEEHTSELQSHSFISY